MGETGIIRFPRRLDPGAEEFRPRNIHHGAQPATLFRPIQLYCLYASNGGLQPLPFCDGAAVGVPYPHFSAPAAYVSPPAVMAPPATPSSSSSPTRSLLLSSLPSELVSESSLRRDLEVFGDVRGIQMERLRDGLVTVHFYDLRHAETALMAIRKQHMQQQTRLRNHYASLFKTRNSLSEAEFYAATPPSPPARGLIAGRAVWVQYIVPAYNAVPDGQNQGTIVIFNLDSEVTAESLREIFETFGPVKESRDTPSQKNQRIVEFFDIRDAAKALKEMNGKEIHGKAVVIEFSRPGGHGRKFFNAAATISENNVCHTTKPLNFPPPAPPLPRKFSRRCAPGALPRSHLPPTQLSTTPTVEKGSTNVNSVSKSSNFGSIEAAMASMNLGGEVGNGIEEKQSDEHNSSISGNSIKNNSSETTVGNTKHQQHRIKHWKGKLGKKHETDRFLIKEDAIVDSSGRDSRTTVMIKNIPNKYSQKLLLNMLDNHCIHCNEQIADSDDQPLSSYDFVYLPIDFNNKCNVGYGFVNMTSPEATLRLYKTFHLQHWEVFNSRKICEITYARVQGLEALKEHFKNSKFPCEMDHYLPVAFSPPRDGRQLTEPLPIVGHKKQTHPIGPPHSSDEINSHDRLGASSDADNQHDVLSISSQKGVIDGDDDDTKTGEVAQGSIYHTHSLIVEQQAPSV